MAQGLAEYYGNIDLDQRQVYRDPKTNRFMTENSTSIQMGSKDNPIEVLIPTVVDGKLVSEQDAINHFLRTREDLGAFNMNDWLNANRSRHPDIVSKDKQDFYKAVDDYANKIHLRQQKVYGK